MFYLFLFFSIIYISISSRIEYTLLPLFLLFFNKVIFLRIFSDFLVSVEINLSIFTFTDLVKREGNFLFFSFIFNSQDFLFRS